MKSKSIIWKYCWTIGDLRRKYAVILWKVVQDLWSVIIIEWIRVDKKERIQYESSKSRVHFDVNDIDISLLNRVWTK